MVKKQFDASTFCLESFSSRFSKESDRACAVLGAALLDAMLSDLFSRRLVDHKGKLLGPGRPLDSFSVRINLAYALSWIDHDIRSDLDTIRDIRNDFAHTADHEFSFSTPSVSDRCRNLITGQEFYRGFEEFSKRNRNLSSVAAFEMRDAVTTPRWRFQITVETLAQLIPTLSDEDSRRYSGPSLRTEAFEMSANLRFKIKVQVKSSPPDAEN